MSEVTCSKSSNIFLLWFARVLALTFDINKNAISTLWIIAKKMLSQKLSYDFIALVFLNMQPLFVWFCRPKGGSLKILQTLRCKTFCFTKLNSTRSPQSHQCLNGFFLTVLIVAVSFLRIHFTIIWACMEVGRRNKPSIGIKVLPIF